MAVDWYNFEINKLYDLSAACCEEAVFEAISHTAGEGLFEIEAYLPITLVDDLTDKGFTLHLAEEPGSHRQLGVKRWIISWGEIEGKY